jgi:hypothetical protein
MENRNLRRARINLLAGRQSRIQPRVASRARDASAHLLARTPFVRRLDDDPLNGVGFPDVSSVIDWSQQPMCHGCVTAVPEFTRAERVRSRGGRFHPPGGFPPLALANIGSHDLACRADLA